MCLILYPGPLCLPELLQLPCTPHLLFFPLLILCLCLKAVTLQLGPQGLTCSGSDGLPSRLILTYSHHPPLTRQQAWATSLSFPRCASLFYLQACLDACGLLQVCLHHQVRTRPVPYLYKFRLSARRVRVQNCCVY